MEAGRSILQKLFADPTARQAAGERARDYVNKETGATGRILEHLNQHAAAGKS